MKLRWGIIFAAILAVFFWTGNVAVHAGEASAPPSARSKEWTPSDIVYTQAAGQFQISPDGRWVVWVKAVPNKEKDMRTSNLMLSSLTSGKEIQLTRGDDEVMFPRWSPDGTKIAFLSTRQVPKEKKKANTAKMQLWMMDPFGGEAWDVTAFDRAIHEFAWRDNHTIVYSAEEEPTLYEEETKKRKDDTDVVDDAKHKPPVRLFLLDVKSGNVTRITHNDDWIRSFSVSRDGQTAVTINNRELSYPWDQKTPPAVFIVDLATGKSRPILADGKIRPRMVRWAPDNSGFYMAAPYPSEERFDYGTITALYFYDRASDRALPVDLGWEKGMGYGFDVTHNGFVALLADGTRFQAGLYTKRGDSWTHAWLSGEHASGIFGVAISDDGKTLVYDHSTPAQPTQWYRARLDGAQMTDTVQLTHLNPQLNDREKAKAEVIHWKGADDESVDGILYYPDDYRPGKRYPLILAIHGGPGAADLDGWDENWAYPTELYTQRGAFVLKPNYHGSGNYGLKWKQSICCGKYYSLDIEDIQKGVDALIGEGLVDPNQIGSMGWSNGAILTIKLTTIDPARYKTASAGAGEVEWISDWANVDFGQSFDTYYFGASMPDHPELYLKMSPLLDLSKVRTPTIIFQGTVDRNVPTDEGWTYYRTLYYFDKAPVKFLLFPGEPHGPRKFSHQLRKVTAEAAWFDKYFFKTAKPEDEALKPDSPLAYALRLRDVKKSNGLYGVDFRPPHEKQSILIPEVVMRGNLEMGRFEVTRAQFAAFDQTYRYAPGTGNYPANGVTLAQAKAYVEWLSKRTGQTYRLPEENEVASLYKAAEKQGEGNTLDYWAGYKLNPDDARRLEAEIKQLPGNAPLLKPVDSFSPEGGKDGALLFDLGGNVAEWTLTSDGSGVALGGSADRAADARAQSAPPDLAYTGLRVVRGAAKATAGKSAMRH